MSCNSTKLKMRCLYNAPSYYIIREHGALVSKLAIDASLIQNVSDIASDQNVNLPLSLFIGSWESAWHNAIIVGDICMHYNFNLHIS